MEIAAPRITTPSVLTLIAASSWDLEKAIASIRALLSSKILHFS